MHTLIKSILILFLIPNVGICASQEGKATGQLPVKSSPVGKDLTTIGDSQNINPTTHLPRSRDVELEDLPISIPTQVALNLKENSVYVGETAPADTTRLFLDSNEEAGVLVQKKYVTGIGWVRVGSYGVQYSTNCESISAGMCVDTANGKLYYHNNTSVVEVGSGGSVDLSAYLSKTNTTAFTPTADYHPATMKFVLDSITAGGGYTDEQAQDASGGMFSGNTETGITVTYNDTTGKVDFVVPTTLASFTDDSTHRLVTDTEKTTWNAKQNALVAGTDYLTPNGSAANLTSFPTLNQNTTGSAATLTTARTIGGVSFNGSANINLPGVNASGTQNTSGTAAGLTAQYIDWNSASGGSSIANKPTIPNASSLSVDDLITLSGVATGAVNLGTFTGATIADSSTVKTAIQAVETAVETKANASGIAFEATTWSDLKILDTTHTTAGTGIAVVQDAMAYGNADDAYHLWSIDKIGSELAGKQATDSDLTSAAGASSAGASKYWGTNASSVVGFYDLPSGGGTPTTITVADTTDTTAFIAIFDSATGDLGPKTDGGLTYNASTGMLTATGFTGPVTGTASGNLVAGGNIGAGTATTPSANDNDTSIATTAYVQGELTAYASDTVTLTNKTIDTAATGNAITVPLNGALDGAITNPADADDMIYARAANAMTVTGIDCQAEGTTPSITVTLQKCNDLACGTPTAIEAAITCDSDGGVHASTIDSASIAADTPIKVLFGSPSGVVTSVRWRVIGTQTW